MVALVWFSWISGAPATRNAYGLAAESHVQKIFRNSSDSDGVQEDLAMLERLALVRPGVPRQESVFSEAIKRRPFCFLICS